MAFTITGTLIVDETSGTQNSTAGGGDLTGNDVADGLGFISSGVTAFDTLLAAVVTQDLTGVNVTVAVSGGTSSDPDGSPMLSGFGADVIDLAFTNSTGGALSGVEALSAPGVSLRTVDGSKIYLYSYSVIAAARGLAADLPGVDENNVVFGLKADPITGLADPDGAVVFAAYLQATDALGAVQATDAGAVGSKVWLVEYEEIKHPTTDPDEGLNLYNLYVSVSNRVDFSLEGAPSGQNLFLMYADGTPAAGEAAIVVTGKDPINQSSDSSGITSGDTVNTGQGGGGTTIGTNNQMIDPLEGMYFSFVTLSADSLPLTVPNLDQNEADVEANIKFASYLGANEAIFTVVQLQPPKAATMKLSAFNVTDTTETGIGYIDGLNDGDDAAVNITEVKISWSIKAQGKTFTGSHVFTGTGLVTFTDPDTGITRSVDFTGDTVTITGVVANDEINYKTATDHNRVLIENIGNTNDANLNAAFDIGGFSLIRSSVTPNQFAALTFQDDGPSISTTGTEPTATVDETVLATNATADFSVNFTSAFGADGAGTLAYALGISSVGAVSGLTDTATNNGVFLFLEGGVVVGREGTDATDAATGDIVFTASVNSTTGVVTLDQQRAIVHPVAGSTAADHDDNKTLAADTLITLTATKTDGDGDTASATLNIAQNLNFEDDGPSISTTGTEPTATVDETVLATNATADFSVNFTSAFGADGAGTLAYALGI
ncbi:DUF5801 repeats-in-toxin domain-containing protein, partial [Ramlibacter sp. 2FC]|uniref:DUF5801 repeats-in-toxin domain-containing protein n=1 Tax=Ramlibacter sp. 2FC TaxID=2502188 RepID=UPI0010F5B1BC